MRHPVATPAFDTLMRAAEHLDARRRKLDAPPPHVALHGRRAPINLPKLCPTSSDFDSELESKVADTMRVTTLYPIHNKNAWRLTRFENVEKCQK